jgi:hypothetical protein
VNLYLGQGLALLQARGQPTQVLQPSATLPLERVLQQISEHVPRASRLRISLSGAICPAFDCVLPQGVRRWQERQTVARSWAAEGMGLSPDALLCELDARSSGLGAALSASTLAELQDWAQAQGHRIGSVQPLWAQATQSGIARQASARGVLVQEPDAITLLAEQRPGCVQAFSLAGAPDAPATQARLAQWRVSLGGMPEHLARFGFDAQPRTPMADGPQAWAAHWYTP